MGAPSVAIIFDAHTGQVTNVTVLASDTGTRLQGFAVIQQLRDELEVFEERIKFKLAALARQQ